ncbi:MAG: tRNA (adenosine(37)-N6)-dimethylallyltransferase MiaA [Verrucomicrobiota bacterium]
MKKLLQKLHTELKTETPFFVLGPTGIGKSALALEIADQYEAEIVSIDAFQIYKQLDIGTGKISTKESRGIPHHLIDIVDPLAEFSAASYLKYAQPVVQQLTKTHQKSIWVGGNGFYYRALRQGLTEAPASDPQIISRLEKKSVEELRDLSLKHDPDWAAGADLHNPRRMARALAVYEQTGKPLSIWQKEKKPSLVPEASAVCLVMELDDLRKKISERVKKMWQDGWPDEVQHLLERKGWIKSQSFQALGYAQVADYLADRLDKKTAIENIILKTGQFAKRQLTWFRGEKNLQYLKV